jgi:hypothetical protein
VREVVVKRKLGVRLDGGVFTMNGGTISDNDARYAGGVYVNGTGATFTMNGGSICDNTAEWYGGGVYVIGTGVTFRMNGGEISGNNTVYGGGGVFLYDGGTLTGNPQIGGTTSPGTGKGWIHGNTATQNPATNDVSN